MMLLLTHSSSSFSSFASSSPPPPSSTSSLPHPGLLSGSLPAPVLSTAGDPSLCRLFSVTAASTAAADGAVGHGRRFSLHVILVPHPYLLLGFVVWHKLGLYKGLPGERADASLFGDPQRDHLTVEQLFATGAARNAMVADGHGCR